MIVLQLLLWVIAGILGLILILLMLIAAADFAVRVRYEKDKLSVAIGIWPVMIQVWPFDSQKANQKPPAKKKPRKRRTAPKKAVKKTDKQLREQPADMAGILETLKDLFIASFPPATEVFSRLRLRNISLHIHVAEGDAAATAIRYGQLCAILETSSAAAVQIFNMKIRHLGVSYDFLGRRTTVLFSGEIRLRGIHLLIGAVKMAVRYLQRVLGNKAADQPKSKNQTGTSNAG